MPPAAEGLLAVADAVQEEEGPRRRGFPKDRQGQDRRRGTDGDRVLSGHPPPAGAAVLPGWAPPPSAPRAPSPMVPAPTSASAPLRATRAARRTPAARL